jgi:putative Ca2+/H+ antiporter (TMEM165/GDT1 family)
LGAYITNSVDPTILRWLLGASFIGMAMWTLIPDKIEEEETEVAHKLGVFGATFVTFFLAEMGDKTQIATVALAAHYATPLMVVVGTTLGMLIADVPAVFVGDKLADKNPLACGAHHCSGDIRFAGCGHAVGRGQRLFLISLIARGAESNCETPRNTCASGLCRW